jgi:sortase (surface protein transpeptidase)
MTKRLQVDPKDTHLIKNFKKDGADTIAMITCKDGTVL